MNKINTYIFLDLETTGFPCQERNRTQITECAMVAVKKDHFMKGEVPRVLQKLTVCFKPTLPIIEKVFEVTGLNSDLLKNENSFTSYMSVNTIRSFLELQMQPVCFVSHNGCRFDFPILRAEIDRAQFKLPDTFLCTDSLMMFRAILSNKTSSPSKAMPELEFDDTELPFEILKEADECEKNHLNTSIDTSGKKRQSRTSYKLKDVYQRLTGKNPEGHHHAENDSMMLLESCAKMSTEFIEWTENHSIPFNNIPKMETGKPFSTCFISL